MRYLLRALLVLSYVVRPLLAARQPILPHPQQIEYGSGRLPLRGASIGLGSETGPEDRFAANELASALSLMAGTTIPVVVGPVVNRCPPASAIVLVLTGPVDALPGPDDHAGAAYRGAYIIRVYSRCAGLPSRFSAELCDG